MVTINQFDRHIESINLIFLNFDFRFIIRDLKILYTYFYILFFIYYLIFYILRFSKICVEKKMCALFYLGCRKVNRIRNMNSDN